MDRRLLSALKPWRRLPSTPLLASGFFDSRLILRDSNSYAWTCVAMSDLLAGYLEKAVDATTPSPLRRTALLAVSPRAGTLAAGIAMLLGETYLRTLTMVAATGPLKTIREPVMFRDRADHTSFIFITDFIVGGSELRSAEILAQLYGGRVVAAVSMATALSPDEYGSESNILSLHALPTLTDRFKCSFA